MEQPVNGKLRNAYYIEQNQLSLLVVGLPRLISNSLKMPLESLHRLHQLNEHLKHIERDVEQTTKNRFTPYGDPRDRDYRRILVFYINFLVRWKKFD